MSPRPQKRTLTAAEVAADRDAYRRGEVNGLQLAARRGVRENTIKQMLTGVTYRDVPGWLTRAEMRAVIKRGRPRKNGA